MLWDHEDPHGSEARLRAAMPSASPRDRQLLMTQLARAMGLQARWDDGFGLLAITEAVDPEIGARIHLERGRLHRCSGQWAKARFELEAAVRDSVGYDAVHVDALHLLALMATPEEQRALQDQALQIARSSKDLSARDWDATILTGIGMSHADAGEWQDALAAFELALGSCERQGNQARTRGARWMVAWAMRNLGRTFEALSAQRILRAELDAIGESDPQVDEEIALLEAAR